jgi:hypothetical protein
MQLMVEPMLLVETGQTYEAAAIQKWLASHDTCPVTGGKLSSKQTTRNYALKGAIADWAAATANADTRSTYSSAQSASIGIGGMDFPGPNHSGGGNKNPCHCTRTRWAIAAIAVLLFVALAVGLGVGVVTRNSKGKKRPC